MCQFLWFSSGFPFSCHSFCFSQGFSPLFFWDCYFPFPLFWWYPLWIFCQVRWSLGSVHRADILCQACLLSLQQHEVGSLCGMTTLGRSGILSACTGGDPTMRSLWHQAHSSRPQKGGFDPHEGAVMSVGLLLVCCLSQLLCPLLILRDQRCKPQHLTSCFWIH